MLLFVSTYIVFWGAAVQIISQPAMNADALDYQQYKTGDRYEGMSGNLGMIGQIIALGTGFIIPAIYEINGLLDDYDILYDPALRAPLPYAGDSSVYIRSALRSTVLLLGSQ